MTPAMLLMAFYRYSPNNMKTPQAIQLITVVDGEIETEFGKLYYAIVCYGLYAYEGVNGVSAT